MCYNNNMAIIVTTTGQSTQVPRDKAETIWEIMQGTQPGTPAQENFCRKIKHIIMSWRDAPDDYIEENRDVISRQAIKEWKVNRQGKPSRPDSQFDWNFAHRWGLWSYGKPSPFAQHLIDRM